MMSIKRKFNKLVNNPQQFFADAKIVKKMTSQVSDEVGKVVEVTNRKSEAVSNLNKASTTFKNLVVNASLRSMEHVENAKKNLVNGDLTVAIELTDKAIALDEENLFAYLVACEARSKLENMPLVYQYSKIAYEKFPKNSLATMNYLKCLKKVGILNEQSLSLFESLPVVFTDEENLNEYVQYAWELGIARKDVSEKLLNALAVNTFSHKTMALIGAYVYEAGYEKEALRIAKEILDEKGGKFLKKYGLYYIYINRFYNLINNGLDQKFINLLDEMKLNQMKLIDRIKDSKRVVVVGNSPREMGLNKGSDIDSSDLVIRFNNFPCNEEFNPHYGEKCDIWVRSIGSWVEDRDESNFKHVVVSGTNLLSRGLNLKPYFKYLDLDTELSVFESEFHYKLINLLGGPPSAGLMMLYMVYCIKGHLNESDIFGFGFVDQLSEGVVNIGKSPAGVRHHWELELQLYESMIKGEL